MKYQKIFGLVIVMITIALSSSSAMNIPEACTSGPVEESSSYEGNWDMHVGGCWLPPEPHTCTVCNYI